MNKKIFMYILIIILVFLFLYFVRFRVEPFIERFGAGTFKNITKP
ncbi:MAG: hypothetical protein AABW41_04175 [Nanoarchaeota archaeon]